ncbi:NAD(P)H-hydrate epimerase [Lentibacillus persicus]|uniref:Bifunctional NAD(P)H-hydrate repair enzyme n=1 Tax=Lentibacillus persicus TaxID=640948 RepID=A0A1I1ZW32_9BACI|nr:NAD(P)H-hydrate dehydratase [Lentibacillus persicus]SFE35598.1 NAD(P)H-hydrate epimerase [Lentibacillus persicus]
MKVVTAEEMYDMDHRTIQEIGIDGKLLMENAGRAMAEQIASVSDKMACIRVFAGGGNNGGDGFVIARVLLELGVRVSVVQVVPDEKIKGDALFHKNLLIRCGGDVEVLMESAPIQAIARKTDIIVDAMLGIGVSGVLREPLAQIVKAVNETDAYVIAVDIPSGLPANEESDDFQAVQADETIIAGYPKVSAFLEKTAPYYGNWNTVSFGLPRTITAEHSHRQVWTPEMFQKTMPERKPNAHKGNHGRGLVIGGNSEMPGSMAMTVSAALRTGAGLVTAATVKEVIPTIAAHCAEATYLALNDTDGYADGSSAIPFENFDAAVLGMGLGRRPEAAKIVQQAIKTRLPLIIDADGLFHLKGMLQHVKQREEPVVLTPHPGEMAMLLDIGVPELLKSPFSYSKRFAEEYHVYVVLKGRFTIVTTPEGNQTVSDAGNSGLAKGGTGDVLSGVTLAMIMQKQPIPEALNNACFVHGKSAELLTKETHSVYDLMATDVIKGIKKVYRTFQA